MRFNI